MDVRRKTRNEAGREIDGWRDGYGDDGEGMDGCLGGWIDGWMDAWREGGKE